MRSYAVASLFLGQAAILLVAGTVTLWYSQNLMIFLIHLVGEERALGPASVIRSPDGSTLLTNPGAMARWMTPFWALGAAQITSAFSLAFVGARCLAGRPREPDSAPR
jgi:hypothetical protein